MARVQFRTGNEQYGNLANLRKAKGTGKQVGQILNQQTGQAAHVEGHSTVPVGQNQPTLAQQPVVTDNSIAQLNKEQETEQLQKQLKQATIEQEKLDKRMTETQADLAKKERELAGLDREKHPHRAAKLEKQIAQKNKVLSDLGGKQASAAQKVGELRNKLNISVKPEVPQIATSLETTTPKASTSTVKAGEHAVENTVSHGITSTVKAGEQAAESSVSQGVTRAVQSEETAATKGSKGFLSKAGKFFKGKKGIVAVVGAALAIGATVVAAKSCSGGDTPAVTPTKPEGTKPVAAPADTTQTDSVKAQPAPQAEETEEVEETNAAKEAQKVQEEQELQEADEADKAQQAAKEHEAQKGDTYWGYARFELIAEHQGDPNYKPTNAEIAERMQEIMKRNGAKMDKDGNHPLPMLNAGDKVKVKAA